MSLFPVPVSGQKIPRGWFGRLVRFINSLVLRGDGSYLAVEHTPDGTLIKPTTYLIDQLNKAGNPPAAGGSAAQDISASVTGGTATVTLSGSTSAVELVGAGDVTISGNTSGQIEINATGGTASALRFPNYPAPLVAQGNVQPSYTYPGTAYAAQPVWLIGNLSVEPDENGQLALSVCIYISNGGTTETVYLSDFLTQTSSYIDKLEIPVFLPIAANHTFQINVMQTTSADPTSGLAIYPCL